MLNIFILTLLSNFSFCEYAVKNLSLLDNIDYEQVEVCNMLLEEAQYYKIDKKLLLAVSWKETNLLMKSTPNTSNCVGPLQIKYKYWCPNKKGIWSIHKSDGTLNECDLIERGVFAFHYYMKKKIPLKQKICLFGPAYKCSCLFGKNPNKHNCKNIDSQKASDAMTYVMDILRYKERIKNVYKR